MLQLFGTQQVALQKPLKSLHRRAIKIVLLKRTSLTDKDYKAAQILPLFSRLMCDKARFVLQIVSTDVSINKKYWLIKVRGIHQES